MSTLEAYARQLKALLPQGVAWNLEPGSMVSRVMLALAEELARVHARAVVLIDEIDPRTTLELLPDWERMLALPDICAPAVQTLQERRDAATAKYTTLGGQSPQFYIDLAAALGYEVTITEFFPFRAGFAAAGDALTNDEWHHAWRVNARETTVRRFTAGLSAAGEPLRDWGNEELECAISLRRPAHSVLIFGYPPPMAAAIESSGEPAGILHVENTVAAIESGGTLAGSLTVVVSADPLPAAAIESAGALAGSLTVEKRLAAAVDGTSTPSADLTVEEGRTALDVLAESVGWWEADDASNTVVSDAFSQLTDLSGNGNHFVQATAGLRPARLDTGGIISAEFDGANPSTGDDVMTCASPTAALMNNFNAGGSSVAVFRSDGGGEGGSAAGADWGGRLWCKNDTGKSGGTEQQGECLWMDRDGLPSTPGYKYDVNLTYATTNGRQRPTTSITGLNGAIVLVDIRVDKTGGDADLAMYVNGAGPKALGMFGAEVGAVFDNSALTISLGNRDVGDRTFDGGIHALAFWDTQLSDTDMALVRAYWATKYGVTLP